MRVEFRSVYACELRFGPDAHPAPVAHPGTIDHQRVQACDRWYLDLAGALCNGLDHESDRAVARVDVADREGDAFSAVVGSHYDELPARA